MALSIVVETGAGVAGANVYEAVADIATRLTDRGKTAFSSATASQKVIYAVEGAELADHMALMYLQGAVSDEDQGLLWPRIGEHAPRGTLIDSDVVPEKVKLVAALFAEALAAAGGDLKVHEPSHGIRAESRDGESLVYKSGGGTTMAQRFPEMWRHLTMGVDLMLRNIRA